MKAKLIILYHVKYHLIPHLTEKNIAHDMWKYLQDLFHNKKENWLLVLRENLKSTRMLNGEGVALYLTRLSQVRDEIHTIEE